MQSGISTVVVVDALDECEAEGSASAILSVLGRLVSDIPKVKFFLTGRPEPRVSGGVVDTGWTKRRQSIPSFPTILNGGDFVVCLEIIGLR